MWEMRTQSVHSGVRFHVFEEDEPLSFRELFIRFEENSDFARWYGSSLADCGLAAFFWEHPPLTTGSFDDEAEFVLIESSTLASLQADPTAFEPQFARAPNREVLTLPNLGGDALLVVPSPAGPAEAYPHLAAFVRNASGTQALALWRAVGEVVRKNLSPTPRWLSTAGLGVSWLHVRLDSRPKYYRYLPYKVAT